MHVIEAISPSTAFLKTCQYVLDHGSTESGLLECLNVGTVIRFDEKSPNIESYFMKDFIDIFGQDRYDAKAVTFIEPKMESNLVDGTVRKYSIYKDQKNWKDTYWSRMWNYDGKFNQVEQAIKRLKVGQNSKTISIIVHHPIYDGKLTMGMPCLYSINLSPRNGELYLNANWRSNAISKSGYCDFTALYEMGLWIAKESGLTLKEITSYTHSSHIRTENDEKNKVKTILKLYEGKI